MGAVVLQLRIRRAVLVGHAADSEEVCWAMTARVSLATVKSAKRAGAPVVLQIGAPGLFCTDHPGVKGIAAAFVKTLEMRKQDVLAERVRRIMAEAGGELEAGMDGVKIDGDKIEG